MAKESLHGRLVSEGGESLLWIQIPCVELRETIALRRLNIEPGRAPDKGRVEDVQQGVRELRSTRDPILRRVLRPILGLGGRRS